MLNDDVLTLDFERLIDGIERHSSATDVTPSFQQTPYAYALWKPEVLPLNRTG